MAYMRIRPTNAFCGINIRDKFGQYFGCDVRVAYTRPLWMTAQGAPRRYYNRNNISRGFTVGAHRRLRTKDNKQIDYENKSSDPY